MQVMVTFVISPEAGTSAGWSNPLQTIWGYLCKHLDQGCLADLSQPLIVNPAVPMEWSDVGHHGEVTERASLPVSIIC